MKTLKSLRPALATLLLGLSLQSFGQDVISLSNPGRLQGSLVFWTRPACAVAINCPLPIPASPPIPVDFNFEISAAEGAHLIAQESFTYQSMLLELNMVWVQTAPNSKNPPYLVTQMRILANGKVISECSRYDEALKQKFIPPGSCSGRTDDGQMIGVSLMSQ